MAILYFKVGADYQAVVKLKEEVEKLKSTLLSMNRSVDPKAFDRMNKEFVKSQKELNGLTVKAGLAGATMSNELRVGVYAGEQAVNNLTEKIIKQREAMRNVEADVRRLSNTYRTMDKGTVRSQSTLSELNSARKALEEERATLFGLQTEQSNAKLSVKRLKDEYAAFSQEGKNVVVSNGSIEASMKKALVAIGGVSALKNFASSVINVRAEVQMMDKSFEVLLGNKAKSDAMLTDIKDIALKSPLSLTDVSGAAQTLLGFNVEAEKVIPTLTQIGNISMGNSQRFNSLSLAFAQCQASGRLMGQDLNQMINAGFNPLQIISEKTGKTIAQLKDEMSKGAISSEMVADAFKSATEAGGKFYGMMESQAEGIKGSQAQLDDAIRNTFNSIGEQNEGLITGSYNVATNLVENYDKVGKVLISLIAIYGTYKVAVMTHAALTKAYGIYDITTKKLQLAATMKNIAATEFMTVKQAILNKTMLANPYVLVATLVIGTAAAMWALHDSTTAAENAQEKYNEAQDEFIKKQEEKRQKTDQAIRTIQDELETEYAKIKAYEELARLSPALTKAYDLEILKTLELTDVQKALNKERDDDAYGNITNNASQIEEKIKNLKATHGSVAGTTSDGFIHYTNNTKELEKFEAELKIYQNKIKEHQEHIRDIRPVEVKLAEAEIDRVQILREYETCKETLEQEQEKIKNGKSFIIPIDVKIDFNVAQNSLKNIDNLIASLIPNKDSGKTYKELVNETATSVALAQKELDKLTKEGSKTTVGAIDKARKNLEKEKAAYKNITGKEYGKDSEQQNKLGLSIINSELALNAERLAIMEDGRKKRLKLSEQEWKEKKTALEKEYNNTLSEYKKAGKSAPESVKTTHESRISENDNAKTKRDTSINTASDKEFKEHQKELTSTLQSEESKRQDAIKERYDKEREWAKKQLDGENMTHEEYKKYSILIDTSESQDSLKGLLDKYQDYTTQRLVVERKFNDDIAILQEQRKKAEESGDVDKSQQIGRSIAKATSEKGKSLMGLDYEQLKQSPEYVRAFENLKQTSSETLNSLLSQLENAKHTAAQVLSPDQLREYTTTIQEIMNELDERNPFQALSDKKQELAEAEQELAQAQIELENARQQAESVKGGAKIETVSLKINAKTGKVGFTRTYLSEAQALDKVREKTVSYNKSKDKVVEKSAKVKKSEKEVRDVVDDLSKSITDVGAAIGGPAGEIISLIGDIGSFAMIAMGGVETASKTTSTAIQTVEKASVILMIISAAIQLATKVASMFAADYSDYNKSKENYEKYVEVLDVIISKQKELVETLTGKEAVKASENALSLIEKQAEAARNLGKERLNSGASAGSHSIGVRIQDNMSKSGWSEAKNALGYNDYNKMKSGRMTGLFDLSVEQLSKLQMEAPEFWAKLDGDVRDYLEQIIACNESVEDMKGLLNESLTQTSFDSVREGFLDALSDMDSSAVDFADDFSSYMQKAILNTMMAKTYEKRLNDWYESFAESNEDGNIDSADYGKLQKEWEDIVSDALTDRDRLKDIFGWKTEEESSQTPSSGGLETISQDTGTELNGRFTALQMAGEEIKLQNTLQTQEILKIDNKLDAIITVNASMRDIADEIRTIQVNSYLELQEIRENTGAIIKPIKDIAKDMAEVKRNTSKL